MWQFICGGCGIVLSQAERGSVTKTSSIPALEGMLGWGFLRGDSVTGIFRGGNVLLCWLVSCIVFGSFALVAQAQEGERERILEDFSPYRDGPPQVEGIQPGLKLDATNATVASAVLPPEIQTYLAAGDFSITVQETTDLQLRQAFIDATLQHHSGVVVGEGELQNYVAGRPFPVLDADDPQAGLKAVWNLRYRDQGDDAQMWATNSLVNSNGNTERSQSFAFFSLYGMHRPDSVRNVPQWEKQGIYTKQYTRMLAPSDSEGNQILSVQPDSDFLLHDQWAYDPKTRRTRKIVYTPYISPGRGVVLIEDRSGFLGYIHAYDWKYVREQTVLAPGPIRASAPTWGGRGNWYLIDPWELRQAVVVEATPKISHPLYSRRILYIDVQTSLPLFSFTYDHAGEHKRSFLMVARHPEFDPWGNTDWVAQIAAQGSIDYQLERANNFQITKILLNRALPPSQFTVMTLMLRGK